MTYDLQEPDESRCPSCNAEIARDAVLCVSCGYHLKKKIHLPVVGSGPIAPPIRSKPELDSSRPTRRNQRATTKAKKTPWFKNRWVWALGSGGVVVAAITALLMKPRGAEAAFWKYAHAAAEDEWGLVYDLSGEEEQERIRERIDRYLQVTRPRPRFPEGMSQRELFIEISKRSRQGQQSRSDIAERQRAQREKYVRRMKVVRVEYHEQNQLAVVVYINPTIVMKETRRAVDGGYFEEVERSQSDTYEDAVEKKQFFTRVADRWKFYPHDERAGDINGVIF